jgi:hypothetical protein
MSETAFDRAPHASALVKPVAMRDAKSPQITVLISDPVIVAPAYAT